MLAVNFDRETDMDDVGALQVGAGRWQGLVFRPAAAGQPVAFGVRQGEVDDFLAFLPAIENVAQRRVVAGCQRHRDGDLVGLLDGGVMAQRLLAEVVVDQAHSVADQQRQHQKFDQQAADHQAEPQAAREGRQGQGLTSSSARSDRRRDAASRCRLASRRHSRCSRCRGKGFRRPGFSES
ncbi:hypothetical protein SDC9_157360 [bioreactor metagenome]|uniref:Uncharacterized protein n=1 Tax=bioreactor metagenome TaxID=1076179 RepID=A0A645F780_9ZZZZ